MEEAKDLQLLPPLPPTPWLLFLDREEDTTISESSEDADDEEEEEEDDEENEEEGEDELVEVEEDEENEEEAEDELVEVEDEELEDEDGDQQCRSQTLYSIPEGRSYVRHIADEIRRGHCWTCVQGWMIIHDLKSPSNCFLLNPLTMHKIQLPPLQLVARPVRFHDHKLVLSSSPVAPDGCCTVLFVDFNNSRLNFCNLNCVSGWVSHDYHDQIGEGSTLNDVIAVNKKFYGLMLQANIALVETFPVPKITVLKMERMTGVPGRIFLTRSFLESCGEAFLVEMYMPVGNLIEGDIRVHKMKIAQRRWEEVKSIGDRAFFVSDAYCGWSCTASELGLKKNCIYYDKLLGTELCIFDMAKGTVLIDQPCPNLSFPSCYPLWIMPPI